VISDYDLPGMSGVEFFTQVTSLVGEADKVPFILVTAEAKKENVMKAIEAGVSDYLLKPFSPAKLEEKISQVLENA
jgi:two-component system chemotaxis response regulator CheY